MNLNLSVGNIIGSLIFSGVGFIAFSVGKTRGQFKMMAMGALMMGYSMFTSTLMTYLIGAALTALLVLRKDLFEE